jgi:ADP-ribosylglycohydrolase
VKIKKKKVKIFNRYLLEPTPNKLDFLLSSFEKKMSKRPAVDPLENEPNAKRVCFSIKEEEKETKKEEKETKKKEKKEMKKEKKVQLDKNRVKGMFYSLMLGDVLGAPHEFKSVTKPVKYTGKVEHVVELPNRYTKVSKFFPVGIITDDTEMTIALTNALTVWNIKKDEKKEKQKKKTVFDVLMPPKSEVVQKEFNGFKYSRFKVLSSYIDWCNSDVPFLGTNTKSLLRGVKTIQDYNQRVENQKKEIENDVSKIPLSNGCLMRCAPLALLPDLHRNLIEVDTNLTNPYLVCREAVWIQVFILWHLLRNTSLGLKNFLILLEKESKNWCKEIQKLYANSKLNFNKKCLHYRKGYVLNPLYFVFYILHHMETKNWDAWMKFIIENGGDTDTNACIAGAVLGAYWGYEFLATQKESQFLYNIEQVQKSKIDSLRPKEFRWTTFEQQFIAPFMDSNP